MDISKDIVKKCTQKILLARARLLQNNGFYGSLLMYMQFNLSENIRSATCDDKTIIFNPKFLLKLSDKELEYALMHLIMHVVLKHNQRGNSFDKEAFDKACDIVVNSNILSSCNGDVSSISMEVAGGVQDHLAPNGDEGCNYMAEEIYDMLFAPSQGNLNSNESDSDNKSEGKNESGDTPRNGNNGWDEHSNSSNNNSDSKSGDIWIQRIIEAADMTERRNEALSEERLKSCGTAPLFAKRIIDKLRNPQTDWRTVLNEFVQEEVNDYSFTPPDRRFSDLDFFLPDYNEKDDVVHDVLFMIDTSGSMSDKEIADCYSEIKGAIDQFNGKLTGWLGFFDASVTEPKKFSDVDEFEVIKPYGGGGTSFHCIFDYVEKHIDEINPVSIVILTDGYAPFPDQKVAMDIPVLWIINNQDVTPPWGKITRIH